MQKFVYHKDTKPVQASKGVTRRVLAYSPQIMAVEIKFEAGGIGEIHTHSHDQVSYIVSGVFLYTNDGDTKEVRAGDSLYFAPGTEHGVECIEAGCLLDVFTPLREDFL